MYLIFVHIFLFPIKSKQSLKEVLFVFVFFMFINIKVLGIIQL
nr:MAG TPA: hypothetical protein [Caudoviricetes sp.]